MNRRMWQIILVLALALLVGGVTVAAAQGLARPGEAGSQAPHSGNQANDTVTAQTVYTYTTVITVTSTGDPDDSASSTCYTGSWSDESPCTLRRALVEAGELSAGERPVLIKFNVPTTDTGYITTTAIPGAWKIEPIADLPSLKGSQVIIDGDTQGEIGGRTDGPKVIIRLYPNDDLTLGYNLADSGNVVRGLALQEGGIYLYASDNVVEDNWVGLTDDGEGIYYIDDDPRRANYATISGGGSSDGNTIQDNVVSSVRGESIAVQGDNNVIIGNYVGTRADGTIDDVPLHRRCHPDAVYYNWFTGDGIRVSGDNNRIGGPTAAERNVIAGMLFANPDPHNSPPVALEVTGSDNVAQNNTIGQDANGEEVWVCGMGIYIDGERNRFEDNAIVNAGEEAIGIYGSSFSLDAITLQGNVIKEAPLALKFGDSVPEAWQDFVPAQVTQIDGTTVSGTAGAGSPCANCTIELFLDDGDEVTETLRSLVTTTAEADGTWTATLASTLPPTRGLRTASTTAANDQIVGFSAGTTSRFSDLYPDGVTPPDPTPTPSPTPPPPFPSPTPPPTPEPPPTYTTVITVTSAADPDTSASYTCYSDPVGPGEPAPDGLCTLRRALVEAGSEEIDRPVLIKFNIPTDDDGYESRLGAWIIELIGDLPTVKGGQITIDGETQGEIGGRADGPKIIVVLNLGDSLTLGYTLSDEGNVVRGLALLKGEISLFTGGNIVEENWLGLPGTGTGIYYVEGDPRRANYATISGGADSHGNLIRDNVVASARGEGIVAQGNGNTIVGNYLGTKADGTIGDVPLNRRCHPDAVYHNWFTGDGIRVSGDGNWVEGNLMAGMLFSTPDPNNSPPIALEVTGDDNVAQNNRIGQDATGADAWVCGVGIYVSGERNRFLDNTIVNAGEESVGVYGSGITLDAITMQGNTARGASPALKFGDLVPISWTHFIPAQITGIEGTTVNGTAGADSACPYCTVELFLDDGDEVTETLQALVTTTTDADGNWSATLAETLPPTRGLRTASTSADFGQIPDFEVGTTSKFSALYPEDVTPPAPTPEPTPPSPPYIPSTQHLPTPEPPPTHATIITVTSGADPDTSDYDTCYGSYGAYTPAGDGLCTLRRAIVEAGVDAIERPVLVKFNIPGTDDGYTSTLDAWVITLAGLANDLPYVKGGQVVIDGETQGEIGGRSDGPKIIVHGGNVKLGQTLDDENNVVRGLALQMGGIHMFGDRNVVENNWVGLTGDGQAIYYDRDDSMCSNYATIAGGADSGNNLITGCVVATSIGVGIDLEGDDNAVWGNYVGTRADGTLPGDIPQGDRCNSDAAYTWWTGAGIDITGDRNRVGGPGEAERNIVAGMLSPESTSTPPTAINVDGAHNLIQNNYVGKDATGQDVWVCGAAFDLFGHFNRILDNQIANAGMYAFGIYGDDITLDAITLRGNTFENVPKAIEYGQTVPKVLQNFQPGLVTVISGTEVSGISDDDCPYCFVDVYLDDDDPDTEALTHLGYATATVGGDWSFTLPRVLTDAEGLRTNSTTRDFDVIEHFEAGTSSGFSMLFRERPPTPPSAVEIAGSGKPWAGETYNFVAAVTPAPTATLPITYVWRATDQVSITNRGGWSDDADFTWETPGAKRITVTVTNSYGSATGTRTVEVREGVSATFDPVAGGALVYTDTLGRVTVITVPASALYNTTTFSYTFASAPAHGYGDLRFAGRAFDLESSIGLASGGGLTATLSYRDEDLSAAGLENEDENDLFLYYWTGSAWEDVAATCTPASVYHRDTAENRISVRFCHLTPFGLFGGEAGYELYLPLIMKD
jgi:hypothetical protein